MTREERELVADLFDRLATLEGKPRDPEAEQAIREGLRSAPNAIYALVQSVLLQDEALKQADARIQELEAALDDTAGGRPRGFLDSMRDTLFGEREAQRGSVPPVRPAGQPMGAPPQYRTDVGTPSGGPWPQEPSSRGGSFLGTAAAAAAGMIGGGLMLDGIRSMLGGQRHGPFAGAFDQIASDQGRSPWTGGEGGGDLGRQAGLDDIERSRTADYDRGGERASGLFDTAENESDDDSDFDDDGGGFDGDNDVA